MPRIILLPVNLEFNKQKMSTDIKYSIVKLNSNNYFNWRYKLQMLVIEKEVWDVINEEPPNPVTNAWEKKDRKALSTIALNVEDDQIHHIRNCLTAADAWENLKDIHEKDTPNNRACILRKMMTKILPEGGDVEKHLTEINELYQKLIALGTTFKPDFIKSAILLGSLPESYNSLVLVLESKDEELTSNFVYSKILEESQRRKEKENAKKNHSSDFHAPSAMMSKIDKSCHFCKEIGHFKRNCGKYVDWLEKHQEQQVGGVERKAVRANFAIDERDNCGI